MVPSRAAVTERGQQGTLSAREATQPYTVEEPREASETELSACKPDRDGIGEALGFCLLEWVQESGLIDH